MLLNKKSLAKTKFQRKHKLFWEVFNYNQQTKDRLTVQRKVIDVRRSVAVI